MNLGDEHDYNSMQPNALFLADVLERSAQSHTQANAAAEMRRLHAELERCKQVCAATSESWRTDAEESEALRERLSELLRNTAIALRGPEPELTRWSWHDLPELATALKAQRDALQAALAEPVQKPPEFPPHDDKVHAGAIYWYVGTDGKYYSSNEVKLFMQAKNKSLHYEPPKWVLDNFDLIPLYTAPPQRKPLSEDEALDIARTFGAQPWPPGSCVAFARAIERAHGIGGNDE